MVDDERGENGGRPKGLCDDLAQMLANADPAHRPKVFSEWRERRKKEYNHAKAARLSEEAGRLLRDLADEERDRADDLGRIIDYFEGLDPEPLVSLLISGPPLSREGRLWLAQALADVATEGGGQYRRVLKDTPKPRGRPLAFKHSDDVVRLSDRVDELVKMGEKKYRAREIAAEEEGISESQLRINILRHQEWAREIEDPEADDDH